MNALTSPPVATAAGNHSSETRVLRSKPPRFTPNGGHELEAHLARTCQKIAAGIRGLVPPNTLEAVLLGGGYGRGEGGVLLTARGERPYNDLEFYVFLRGNRHLNELRFGRALHVLGEILTLQAGVEVEFKLASLGELARSPISMFSYDLVQGHRWLVGEPELLADCTHHREAAAIPLSEATRLLMNRCSGLLFAREKLQKQEFTEADADFVRRNIAKAELALGDAVLVAHGRYHWSVHERHRRIEALARPGSLPWIDTVRRHHAAGVEFKLHPQRCAARREELAIDHATVAALAEKIWLWLEERRLNTAFRNGRSYAKSSVRKCGESAPLRNILVNLKALGIRPILEGRAARHPRERILNVLPLLLWEPTTFTSPDLLRFVQRELQVRACGLSELLHAYRELWSRVN